MGAQLGEGRRYRQCWRGDRFDRGRKWRAQRLRLLRLPHQSHRRPAPAAEEAGDLTLSPAVRRLVLELGIDPSQIKGTARMAA
jgi:hypothetical protein